MGIRLGMTKEHIDPVHQQIAHGVLHVLGFLVNLIPVEIERLDEKQFDQPMPPVPETRPWTFETVTEDLVAGSIDPSLNIDFMRSSGLDYVDDVTITFRATRVG